MATGIDIRSGMSKKVSIRYTTNPENTGPETNNKKVVLSGFDRRYNYYFDPTPSGFLNLVAT
jgi:hypothetical protein